MLKRVTSKIHKCVSDVFLALPGLPTIFFTFSLEGWHSVTPSHSMEYWQSSWFSFPKAGTDGIYDIKRKHLPISKAIQVSTWVWIMARLKHAPTRTVTTSVSTVHTLMIFIPCSKACKTCTAILVSASSWLHIDIWPFISPVHGYYRSIWCDVNALVWWANKLSNSWHEKWKQFLFVLWISQEIHPVGRKLGKTWHLSAYTLPPLVTSKLFQTIRNISVPHDVQPCGNTQLLGLKERRHNLH